MELLNLFWVYLFVNTLFMFMTTSKGDELYCNGKDFLCVNETSFYICVDVGKEDTVAEGVPQHCIEGLVCNNNSMFECEEKQTVTTVTIKEDFNTPKSTTPTLTTIWIDDNDVLTGDDTNINHEITNDVGETVQNTIRISQTTTEISSIDENDLNKTHTPFTNDYSIVYHTTARTLEEEITSSEWIQYPESNTPTLETEEQIYDASTTVFVATEEDSIKLSTERTIKVTDSSSKDDDLKEEMSTSKEINEHTNKFDYPTEKDTESEVTEDITPVTQTVKEEMSISSQEELTETSKTIDESTSKIVSEENSKITEIVEEHTQTTNREDKSSMNDDEQFSDSSATESTNKIKASTMKEITIKNFELTTIANEDTEDETSTEDVKIVTSFEDKSKTENNSDSVDETDFSTEKEFTEILKENTNSYEITDDISTNIQILENTSISSLETPSSRINLTTNVPISSEEKISNTVKEELLTTTEEIRKTTHDDAYTDKNPLTNISELYPETSQSSTYKTTEQANEQETEINLNISSTKNYISTTYNTSTTSEYIIISKEPTSEKIITTVVEDVSKILNTSANQFETTTNFQDISSSGTTFKEKSSIEMSSEYADFTILLEDTKTTEKTNHITTINEGNKNVSTEVSFEILKTTTQHYKTEGPLQPTTLQEKTTITNNLEGVFITTLSSNSVTTNDDISSEKIATTESTTQITRTEEENLTNAVTEAVTVTNPVTTKITGIETITNNNNLLITEMSTLSEENIKITSSNPPSTHTLAPIEENVSNTNLSTTEVSVPIEENITNTKINGPTSFDSTEETVTEGKTTINFPNLSTLFEELNKTTQEFIKITLDFNPSTKESSEENDTNSANKTTEISTQLEEHEIGSVSEKTKTKSTTEVSVPIEENITSTTITIPTSVNITEETVTEGKTTKTTISFPNLSTLFEEINKTTEEFIKITLDFNPLITETIDILDSSEERTEITTKKTLEGVSSTSEKLDVIIDNDFQCTQSGKFVDKYNCSVFYLCIKINRIYRKMILTCPSGSYYDPKHGICSTQKECTPAFMCKESGIFADPLNDKQFYICIYNSIRKKFTTKHLKCPSGFTFNPELQTCSFSWFADSEENEDSTIDEFICEHPGKFPVENDCQLYYLCIKKKNEFKLKIKKCSNNKYFDRFTNLCRFKRFVNCGSSSEELY